MQFEPEVEDKPLEWMRKPMIVIGYSFSDKIIQKLLIAARGTSPVFLVNPSGKTVPPYIKELDRVHYIKKSFSEFILDLFEILKKKNPLIIERANKILESVGSVPIPPPPQKPLVEIIPPVTTNDSSKAKTKIKTKEDPGKNNPVKKILILAANPKATPRLRLDAEIREIEEGLRLAKHRDRFEIFSKHAVRLKDIRRALLDYEPQIVHFAGHGKKEGLFVEDEMGMSVIISSKALSGLFELFSDKVECVVLNACFSASQAAAINKHIDYVVGMRKTVKDKASIEFAVGFYDALGAGRSVEDAFKFGCNAILQIYPGLPQHLIPVLKKKS